MKIKSRELLFAVAALMQGTSFLLNALLRFQGGWIAFAAALLVSVLPIFFWFGINIFKDGGKVIPWLYIIFLILVSSYNIDLLSSFVKSYILEETPRVLFICLFTAFCVYAVSAGVNRLVQIGLIFFALAVVSDLVNIFLLRDTMKPENFMPVLSVSPSEFIWYSFTGSMILLADVVTFLCFSEENGKKGLFFGYIAGGVLLLGTVLRTVGVLGETSGVFMWPVHEALRLMDAKNAVSRIETSSVFALVAFMFFKVSIILSGATEGIRKLTGIRNKTVPSLVCGVAVAVLASVLFGSASVSMNFLMMWGGVIILPFSVVFPFLLWAKKNKWKKIKKSVDK